jgi:molybdopterin molybdotransferase
MISLAEAQARLMALATPLPTVETSLFDASGRWAAKTLHARRTQPASDLSAMDGYAIRFAECPGPWTVIGESAAGRSFASGAGAGEAVRIFTGAAVPRGCDTILIQEDAARDGPSLRMTGSGPADRGAHIRLRGNDFSEGDTLITAGELLTPARIALAALAGHATLSVRARPRVSIISTGDELRLPGSDDRDDSIPASNGPMLAALLAPVCDVIDGDIVADDLAALKTAFAAAAESSDIVITTGGASVGDHDLVRPALEAAGAQLDFWKIAMRPGKPVMAGTLGEAIMLGLPGNPVSAYVTSYLLALPLARHMAGSLRPIAQTETAILASALPQNGDRLDHRRALLNNGYVDPLPSNDSALLAALASSNALIIREPHSPAMDAGDTVMVYRHP